MQSENIFYGASRPNKETAKELGLDFQVLGPHPYTNVKQPVGSEILLKQGQDVDIKKMASKIGEKLVEQYKINSFEYFTFSKLLKKILLFIQSFLKVQKLVFNRIVEFLVFVILFKVITFTIETG